jgi:hypothetical protein
VRSTSLEWDERFLYRRPIVLQNLKKLLLASQEDSSQDCSKVNSYLFS